MSHFYSFKQTVTKLNVILFSSFFFKKTVSICDSELSHQVSRLITSEICRDWFAIFDYLYLLDSRPCSYSDSDIGIHTHWTVHWILHWHVHWADRDSLR